MGTRWIRKLYLQKVCPPQIAQLLRVHQEELLQRIRAALKSGDWLNITVRD